MASGSLKTTRVGISTTISSGTSLSCCSPMDDRSDPTTLAAFPGVSVPSVVPSSPSRLSRSHPPDDSEESRRSAAGGGGSRSREDCS